LGTFGDAEWREMASKITFGFFNFRQLLWIRSDNPVFGVISYYSDADMIGTFSLGELKNVS